MVMVGLTAQADRTYLRLLRPLFERVDYLEVAPETLWIVGDGGALEPNGFHREIGALARDLAVPVVAHGVGLSLCTADPADDARLQRWLDRIAADMRELDYLWYTDHFGVTTLAGQALQLPLGVPLTAATAAIARERLVALQRVVPIVGFENSVLYFLLGEWLDEPAFFGRVLGPGMHLVLDLHNVMTMAQNLGADAEDYLARLDLDSVLEIHVAGGRRSDPAWLPGGRTMRLDSHDAAVPAAVWELLERWAPRCPNLRGVTLERMEGTVDAADVPALGDELQRLREVVDGR